MTPRLYPPLRSQSIGEVLDSALRIFQVSLGRTLPYGLLMVVAEQSPNIYDLAKGRPLGRFGSGDPLWWVIYVLGLTVALILWNGLLLRQRAIAAGERGSIRADLRSASRKLPAQILMILAGLLAIGIGAFLLVVPAIYLIVALSMSLPTLVLEGRGPLASLQYSVELLWGNWWRAAAVFTVAVAIVVVFYTVAGVMVAVAVPFMRGADIAVISAATAVTMIAVGAVGAPCFSAVVLALFGDLQQRGRQRDLKRQTAAAPSF